MTFSPLGAQPLASWQPFGAYLQKAYVHPGDGLRPMPGMHWVDAPSTALSRGSLTVPSCPPVIPALWWWIEPGDSAVSHPFPLPSLLGVKGPSFPALVQPDDTVNSKFVVGIKPGDFSVLIGFQVDECTHTWSAEHYWCWFTYSRARCNH